MNKSLEMYLKTIYVLEQDHGHAHVVDISDELGITKPSVTKAMNRLKDNGLINKETYGHINLTEKGKKISQALYYKHKMITYFLEKSLGLSHEEASINACRMEHIITEKMLEAIEEYIK
ncbi:MAG TPA: metal-dependent transcriptional regulator [Acholeplasmataceae bacterium]|nr:metal-dependent transcriptional regulator [Acholeplasmataceae bacterium]